MPPFLISRKEDFVYLISLFSNKKYPDKLLMGFIAAITFCIYFNSLNNKFQENWDDNVYITGNSSLKDPKGGIIKAAFTKFSNGHYHPLTTLSYAADYKLFGFDPKPFHATNLALHILNAIMVFIFINLLVKDQFIAFFTALLFAIHPMHVESVAWVSDRKDLLCTLFFTAALYTYLLYLKEKKIKYFGYTLVLFVMSLLSKSMAVTLPFVLLLLDYFRDRKFTHKAIIEKIPFFILSVIFGYLSIVSQKSNNALGDLGTVGIWERILFGSYAIVMYILKIVYIWDLSAFYNYPLTENGRLPVVFYIMPFILMGLIFILYKVKKFRKIVWSGFGFFIVTISLVLQFIPAGNVIMADRYTYLPYIGLFFVIATLAVNAYKNSISFRPLIIGAVFIYSVICAGVSYSRTKVWKDSMSLWSDTINKNPDAALPYANRAALFLENKDYEKALADLNKAISIRPKYITARYNRGVLLIKKGRYREAVTDLDFVLQNNPADVLSVYMERGNAYMFGGNYPKAIEDFTSALRYDPASQFAVYNRGMCYHSIGKYTEAVNDFNTLIKWNPEFAKAYYLKAISLYKLGNYKDALLNVTKAKERGYKVDPGFLKELNSKAGV